MMNLKNPLLIAFCVFANLVTGCGFEKCAQGWAPGGVSETDRTLRSDLEGVPENGGFRLQKGVTLEPSASNHAQEQVVMNWLTYSSTAFGFTIKYPPTYAVFEERPLDKGNAPEPVCRVYFQNKTVLRSETAALEPPQFSIEVFELPAEVPYQDWVQQNKMIPLNSTVEVFPIAGRSGLRVSRKEFIAPGQFVFVADGGWIFRFTLLGEHSPAMLTSLRFSN
jgi:hypothetical protein